MNAGLEVVGDSVHLQKGVEGDGAKFIALATEFLFQLQCLLEAGFSERRLSAGVEQGGVSGVRGLQTSLLHLQAVNAHKNCLDWLLMITLKCAV